MLLSVDAQRKNVNHSELNPDYWKPNVSLSSIIASELEPCPLLICNFCGLKIGVCSKQIIRKHFSFFSVSDTYTPLSIYYHSKTKGSMLNFLLVNCTFVNELSTKYYFLLDTN